MGRRSFGISFSQINRIASASRARAKAREREAIINGQRGISTETGPTYELSRFDFNEQTRVAHIEFLEIKKYRKIERYVTQNHVRHPIYGGWNTRTKTIKKTIKLTNQNLENLRANEDHLIRTFCYEIVSKLGKEDYYPAWFITSVLKDEKDFEIGETYTKYNEKIELERGQIKSRAKTISENESEISFFSYRLKELEKKHDKVLTSIKRAKIRKHTAIFAILTFGIYLAAHSKRRIKRLETKSAFLDGCISESKQTIHKYQESIDNCKKEIKNFEEKICLVEKTRDEEIAAIAAHYDKNISLVEPLPIEITSGSGDFVLLKKVAGMNYEKIIGCYIIRNRENGKCYVGQSKDVLRRLCREHFQGTKINNIIFAEDYYKSSFANKDDLFEVKIIRLKTKDELDRTEKELIEEYDSFNNGYNGTSGNS